MRFKKLLVSFIIINLRIILFSEPNSFLDPPIFFLTMKENVYLKSGETILLRDLVKEKWEGSWMELPISRIKNGTTRVTANQIMDKLCSVKGQTFSLSGDYTLVYPEGAWEEKKGVPENPVLFHTPIAVLKRHLESWIDFEQFHLEIFPSKVTPQRDLANQEYAEIKWQLPMVREGISDISKFRKLNLSLDGQKVQAELDVRLYSFIYLSKVKQEKDDLFKKENYTKQYCDITMISDPGDLVFYPELLEGSVFRESVGAGTILKNRQLSKNPDILKGETVKVLIRRNGIELKLQGKAEENGYVERKISVRTETKKRLSGYLKEEANGEFYVKVQ